MHGNRVVMFAATVFIGGLVCFAPSFPTLNVLADTDPAREAEAHYREHGVDVTSRPWWHRNPLLDAVREGNLRLTKRLLCEAADADEADKYRTAALMIAARRGNLEITELLLNHGADLRAVTARGRTAVDVAAGEGHTEIVKLLLTHGAKQTLSSAALLGDAATVRRLLSEDLAVGSTGETQERSGNAPVPPDLIPSIRVSTRLAAGHGHVKVVKLLLDRVKNLKGNAEFTQSAFNEAVRHGRLKVVKLLLDRGLDVNAATYSYRTWTALMTAAWAGNPAVVRLLLGKGAEINALDPWGQQTALMIAAEGNRPEVVKILLEAGADPNARNRDGETVLMYAASRGHPKAIRLLTDRGADVNAVWKGATALSIAVLSGYSDVVDVLIDAGAKLTLDGAVAVGDAAEVRRRLEE